jgi:hypothetical protein
MTISQFFKGMLMALISVAVVAFTQVPVDYAFLYLTAIATILGYVSKNLIGLVSTSDPGKLKRINYFSALLLAITTGISESVAMLIVNKQVAWVLLIKVAVSASLTYLAGTLVAGPTTQSAKLIK